MNARVIAPLGPPGPARNRTRTIAADDEPDPRVSLAEIVAARGSEPPLHRHRHEDLIIYVLDGELTFHLDGRPVPAATGCLVLVPRGTEHGYTIRSDRARLLVILSPAGAESYLASLHGGSGDGAGASHTVEWLIATAARYGIDITGPPPAPA